MRLYKAKRLRLPDKICCFVHRDLEKAVEDLSELLEEPIDPEKIAELRQKMTDKTVRIYRLQILNMKSMQRSVIRYMYKRGTKLYWRILLKGFWKADGNGTFL